MAWSAAKLEALTQPPSAHVVPPLAERLELPSSTWSISAQLVVSVLLAARRSFSNHGRAFEPRLGCGWDIWENLGIRVNGRSILLSQAGPCDRRMKCGQGPTPGEMLGTLGKKQFGYARCTPIDTNPAMMASNIKGRNKQNFILLRQLAVGPNWKATLGQTHFVFTARPAPTEIPFARYTN
jgi:hypothetical protein